MRRNSAIGILVIAGAFLVTLKPTAAEEAEVDIWESCRPTDTCVIEYDHLSDQTTEPFLFLGYVMDSEQARWKQYRKAIRNYPDVESCLTEEEQYKERPNLLKFDWERVGYGSGADVCIFRVSRSLADLDGIQDWLTYHDFRVDGPHRVVSEDFVSYEENQPVGFIAAYWSIEQYRERAPSLFVSLTGFELVLKYEVNLSLSEAGQIVGSYAYPVTK